MFIGLDVGGTKIATLVTDFEGRPLAKVTLPTDVNRLEASVLKAIYCALEKSRLLPTQITGIGIGIPGMVDHTAGTVTHAVNLGITQPWPLAQILSERFRTTVCVENDVRLAANGVSHYLGIDNLVYLSLGTGFSAGVVIDGHVYRGQSGMAGEIGHVPVTPKGETLEQLIAGTGIVRQARAAGIMIDHAGELYDLAADGHANAIELVKHISFYIARAIHWLVMAYDTHAVVLGGGVLRSQKTLMPALFCTLSSFRAQSKLNAAMLPDEKIMTLPADFNAGEWGAIHMVKNVVPARALNGHVSTLQAVLT